MTTGTEGTDIDRDLGAREDWEQRISTRSDQRHTTEVPDLPPRPD